MRFDAENEIQISVQKDGNNDFITVYEKLKGDLKVSEELTAYANFMLRVKLLSPRTAVLRLYSIARFKTHSLKEILGQGFAPLAYVNLNQAFLIKYRKKLVDEAPKRAARGRSRAHVATINATLSAAYDWIWWLQSTGRVPAFTIGAFPCAVHSLPDPDKPGRNTKPLLLRGAGRGIRSKPLGFVPDDHVKERLGEYLNSEPVSEYVAVRNSLVFRLAERVGLRRGSILSLTIEPFARTRLNQCAYEAVDVIPPTQKLGYQNSYLIPLDLAYEICRFIETLRKSLIESLKSKVQEVFLSLRFGKVLTGGALTRIFSRAMKHAGAPLGAALHAWRHRFVQDEVDREFGFRIENGLDTSDASVCSSVSIRVGHKNVDSLKPYLDSWHTRFRRVTKKV